MKITKQQGDLRANLLLIIVYFAKKKTVRFSPTEIDKKFMCAPTCLSSTFRIAHLSVQCFATACCDNYGRIDNICFLGKPLLLLLGDRRTLQSTLPPQLLFGQILNIQTNLRQLKRTIGEEIQRMEVYNHYISKQKDEQVFLRKRNS